MQENSSNRNLWDNFKCCVIVPTYNNAKTVEQVVRGVLEHTSHVIVVNDGSTDDTLSILKNIPGIHVVSYNQNQGKGWALRSGFSEAVKMGYDYAITIDSDGQHHPEDLPTFLQEIEKNPNLLVIGSRNMKQENVPGKSSFGNKFSNFWFTLETGLPISDTQSGFRLYPVKALSKMKFYTKKYEFEIECIVRAAWKGIKVYNIPISVYYPPKDERVSHFRPFKDFTRISILNTVLVILCLLYYKPRQFLRLFTRENIKNFFITNIVKNKDSNTRITFAIMLGIFMGIAPVWGWQLIIAITLAHILKLNKLIVIVSAHISIPPMIPILIYLSFVTGGWVLNSNVPVSFSTYSSIQNIGLNLYQYLIGSLIFAAACSVFFGLIAYSLLSFFRKSNQQVVDKV